MKAAILLGAGSSLPAGFPSTPCLTDLVLSGNCVERHSNGSYQLTASAAPMTGAVRLTNCMVRRLHAEAERYFSAWGDGPANYETLFYLAIQALDEELGEMENPAIRSFVNGLKADMLPLIDAANVTNDDPEGPYEPHIPNNFQSLLLETRNYIADIVWRRLCRKPISTDHLRVFVKACRAGHVIGISTLCHDTHFETHLAGEGIALSDGFTEAKSGVRYWNGDFSLSKRLPFLKRRLPFLKLHGSVNWFCLRPHCSKP